MQCSNIVNRVFHPGILIKSLDGQEKWHYTCTREGAAHFPCPQCFVSKNNLSNFTQTFEARTVSNMKDVYERAQEKMTKKDRNEMLKGKGMHNIRICHLPSFYIYLLNVYARTLNGIYVAWIHMPAAAMTSSIAMILANGASMSGHQLFNVSRTLAVRAGLQRGNATIIVTLDIFAY